MSYRKMIQNGIGVQLVTLLLINCIGPTVTPGSEVPTGSPVSKATIASPAPVTPATQAVAGTRSLPTALAAARAINLWEDVTQATIGDTREWTNKVELADINGDSLVDILFANGGRYAEPDEPEFSRVFLNRGPGQMFAEATQDVFGPTPMPARVVKVRDVNQDQRPDIMVGTTFQTQSRLYLGEDSGRYTEVTATHLPQMDASIGDLEFGDVDGDGDLDIVLADWGFGNPLENVGGRTMLWLNDGTGRFSDVTGTNMPESRVKFSWELELVDIDNDYDLDILVSCKLCAGGRLFENDGSGLFTDISRDSLPRNIHNYDIEAFDLDGDGYLDLVTTNARPDNQENLFLTNRQGVFEDSTEQFWPPSENYICDDSTHAFFDFDSDGDADILIGSFDCADRVYENDGSGHLKLFSFMEGDTLGTLGIAVVDLNGDHRLDVVQAQGEQAFPDKVYFGQNTQPDTAAPVVTLVEEVSAPGSGQPIQIRARIHDYKSPTMPHDWQSVVLRWTANGQTQEIPMQWYGEYLWRGVIDSPSGDFSYQVCAIDAAGNETCSP